MKKNMTEFEKMRHEEFYDFSSEECLASYYRAKHLCAKLQTMTIEDEDYRKTIEDLIPGIPESSTVAPPFHCDHGHGIKLGENVFINYNGTMLDGGIISIGANTQIPDFGNASPFKVLFCKCLKISLGN